MAQVIQLMKNFRERIGNSAEVQFLVMDALTEAQVREALSSEVPTTFPFDAHGTATGTGTDTSLISGGRLLYLDETEIEEQLKPDLWLARATYKKAEWDQTFSPDSRFSFDTGGGTQHITQSLRTVAKYGARATDQFKGAIGFDGKNVAGCDIVVPVFQWSETHWFLPADLTAAYKRKIEKLTGRVNNADFRGFEVGEVLFLGCAGNRQGDDFSDKWELTFQFAGQRTRRNFDVGDITVGAKRGWEYMWVQYDDDADAVAQVVIKKPIAVYIEQVYLYGDFSDLDIGTADWEDET